MSGHGHLPGPVGVPGAHDYAARPDAPYTIPVFPGANGTPGKAAAIRVGWSLTALLTLGMLGAVPFLVLALHRRTTRAWLLFAGSVVLTVCAFVFFFVFGEVAPDNGPDTRTTAEKVMTDVGGSCLLLLWIGGPIYWFVTTRAGSRAEIRGVPVKQRPITGPGMGPYGPTAGPQPGYWPGESPAGYGPAPTPPPTPAPAAVHHAQADHVERARARLEGLSERLREREQPGPDGPAASPGRPPRD